MDIRRSLISALGASLAAASLCAATPVAADEPGAVTSKVIVTNKSSSTRGGGSLIPRVSIAPRPASDETPSRETSG